MTLHLTAFKLISDVATANASGPCVNPVFTNDGSGTMTNARDEIIGLCRRLAQAHRDKDAEAILACYTEDAVIYDLAPPLSRRGIGREGLAAWLATWKGPIHLDAQDFELAVEGELAYASALNRMRGTQADGTAVDLWFRTTMTFARREGRWRIIHDHSSVPFHMDGSYRAAIDLTPPTSEVNRGTA